MQTPTIGRQLHYWKGPPTNPEQQPEAATVCYVHSASLVNLAVINHDGIARRELSVPLTEGYGQTRCAVWPTSSAPVPTPHA